ncbi:sugar transferase [Exiguobacterium undae]|uniref:sugar transferase n=1 Tax=Exiguobacterium undae TaxID=169177 RepID=UPI00384B6240
MKYTSIKRPLGFIIALIACILLIPIFLCIMCAIKIESRGPVLFKQKRVGLHKKHFNILKFRTMYIETPNDTPTHLLADPDVYITRVGKILRKTSLDELPQLFNILKGEMSFIGPRPALWNQYDLIDERDKYGANDTFPGLTGWAQINGRDELPIEVKAKLDGDYVKNIGLMMDIKCFVATIFTVIKSEGVKEGVHTNEPTREAAATKEI